MIPIYYHGIGGATRFYVRVQQDNIMIGCKVFTGKAAATLREWATKND